MPKPTLLKKLACFCFALSLPVVAQNNFKLPDLGTSAVQVLSIEKERAVGDVMMMQIRGTSRVLQDPVLDEYLTNIGLIIMTLTPLRFMVAMSVFIPVLLSMPITKVSSLLL